MAQSRRRTQAERVEASERAMVKAAAKLIARDGPLNITLAQVGKAAGFSGGLVSHKFGSKTGLLEAVAERIIESWFQRMRDRGLENAEVPALERFLLASSMFLDAVQKRTEQLVALFRLMNESYCALPELRPYFRKYDEEFRGAVAELVELGKEDGSVRGDVDAERFAIGFVGLLRGIAIQRFVSGNSFDMSAAQDVVLGYVGAIQRE